MSKHALQFLSLFFHFLPTSSRLTNPTELAYSDWVTAERGEVGTKSLHNHTKTCLTRPPLHPLRWPLCGQGWKMYSAEPICGFIICGWGSSCWRGDDKCKGSQGEQGGGRCWWDVTAKQTIWRKKKRKFSKIKLYRDKAFVFMIQYGAQRGQHNASTCDGWHFVNDPINSSEMPLNACTQWRLGRKNARGASLCNLVKQLYINVTLIPLLSLNSVNLVQGKTTVGRGESK